MMRKTRLTLAIISSIALSGTATAADMVSPPNSLVVTDSGYVGVGLPTPTAQLHVQSDTGTAKIFVEEKNTTPGKRILFQLVNNGQVNFTMRTTDATILSENRRWDFFLAANGFNINRLGSGGAELVVGNDGSVSMGNKNGGADGFDRTFVLNAQGNLTIDGSLTQGSDRNNKQDIVSVDSVNVLETVAKLPISTWEYKGQDGVKHLGPMAQDFYAAFGLGNTSKGISTIDTGGVALAAIKGLNQIMLEKETRITAQAQQIELLKQRLTRMEAQQERLTQLEELLRGLTVNGEIAQR